MLRRAGASDAFAKFEAYENRIERMEADAELVNPRKRSSLEDEFSKLASNDDLENELAALKAEIENGNRSSQA